MRHRPPGALPQKLAILLEQQRDLSLAIDQLLAITPPDVAT
jgi:hypothetical protein